MPGDRFHCFCFVVHLLDQIIHVFLTEAHTIITANQGRTVALNVKQTLNKTRTLASNIVMRKCAPLQWYILWL